MSWRFPFEFGTCGPLTVRREAAHLGLKRLVRVLYASDLHLGHSWTTTVPAQLQRACTALAPDIILLGGDLADRATALPMLRQCVEELVKVAPVAAIPGNHDAWPGVENVRGAVEEGGGHWLPGNPLTQPLAIDADIHAGASGSRLLCAHYPDVFPQAVQAGYRLVMAGHLHGGQCVFATVRDRLYPGVWFHRWHGLRFIEGDASLLVSRGVADTLPIRFNCPRSVAV